MRFRYIWLKKKQQTFPVRAYRRSSPWPASLSCPWSARTGSSRSPPSPRSGSGCRTGSSGSLTSECFLKLALSCFWCLLVIFSFSSSHCRCVVELLLSCCRRHCRCHRLAISIVLSSCLAIIISLSRQKSQSAAHLGSRPGCWDICQGWGSPCSFSRQRATEDGRCCSVRPAFYTTQTSCFLYKAADQSVSCTLTSPILFQHSGVRLAQLGGDRRPGRGNRFPSRSWFRRVPSLLSVPAACGHRLVLVMEDVYVSQSV